MNASFMVKAAMLAIISSAPRILSVSIGLLRNQSARRYPRPQPPQGQSMKKPPPISGGFSVSSKALDLIRRGSPV
ncbi:MAG: hypothetical protein V7698_19420, partial [Paracoccaceae bacterium]